MKERLRYLLDRYVEKTATAEEQQELSSLIQQAAHEEEIRNYVQQLWQDWKPGEVLPFPDWEKMYGTIRPAPVSKIFSWRRIAVAASLAGMLLVAGYWFFERKSEVGSRKSEVAIAQDVKAPQSNRATITTANGKVIYLDSTANGTLATQDHVQLVKLSDGQIAYTGSADQIFYNTLNNPKGSKVAHITLSDGSQIWLDAGSSLTYPMAFVGNERKVSITGQAYFEVAHDATKPFIVNKGGMNVTVLGTHFNVNAYDDEDAIRVTLLEGSVRVTLRQAQGDKEVGSKKSEVKIVPGQQAEINCNPIAIGSEIVTHTSVDLSQVMAWKNGLFSFSEKTDLQTVLRQLARWYDVTIQYEGNVPQRTFGGDMGRDLSLAQVLSIMDKYGIHCKVEEKTIVVTP